MWKTDSTAALPTTTVDLTKEKKKETWDHYNRNTAPLQSSFLQARAGFANFVQVVQQHTWRKRKLAVGVSFAMKISCDRENLPVRFQLAGSVAQARSPKEILQNIKIDATEERVTLMATDMETGIRIDVEGVDVQTPGKALLHVGRVGMILRESSDDQLSFQTDDTATVVKGLHSEFKLPSANPDEYPSVNRFRRRGLSRDTGAALQEMVKRTSFATDPDSSRFALGGVLMELNGEEVLAVGTDGRRLRG